MKRLPLSLLIFGMMLVGACSREPPPRSVTEFIDDPLLLEAALVRCTQDRAASRYQAECVNAREAVKQVEAKEDARRRAEFEAASERKREALRRTQEAAAEARRRVAEAEKQRQEAEYLAQFGLEPDETGRPEEQSSNVPMAVIPKSAEETASDDSAGDSDRVPEAANESAIDGGTAPSAGSAEGAATDLESVREELRRRNDEGGN